MQLIQKRLYFLNNFLFIIQSLIKNFIIILVYLTKYALQQSRKLISLFHRNETSFKRGRPVMNIKNAKMAIGKMSSFVPPQVLNDFNDEQDVIYHTIKQDADQVVFQLRSTDTSLTVIASRGAKPYDFSERNHIIKVHYNGHIRTFTQSVDAEFYNDVLNTLFSKA